MGFWCCQRRLTVFTKLRTITYQLMSVALPGTTFFNISWPLGAQPTLSANAALGLRLGMAKVFK